MKSIKSILAILFVSVFFMACTSDIAEDETLYGTDDVVQTGEDGTAEPDRERT